ncbi:MAG: PAS domain S-box protein, partial [Pirellulales bacterium]|nr:PAS domain S-box protein [Pirellulales bacterium]
AQTHISGDELFELMSSGTMQRVGTDFFSGLVQHLIEVSGVACALVSEALVHPPTKVRILAARARERSMDDFVIELDGTPCQQTLRGENIFVAEGLQAAFPKLEFLKTINAESYCGVPIYDVHRTVIGHLAIVDDKKMSSNPAEGTLLKMFAMRAGTELERIRMESRLRQREQQLQQIVNTTLDAVVVMDTEGQITEWNQRAERVFGWSRDDAIGRLLHETIIPQRLRSRHVTGIEQFLLTGSSQALGRRMEVIGVRKDGQEFPAEVTAAVMRTEQSISFAAFVRDLTAQKNAELRLRQTEERLAHVSRLCTLGEMVAGVAHEVNQPLTAIANYASVAEMSEEPDVVSEALQVIEEQAHRAGEIIRRFRALATKTEFERDHWDLNELVSESVALVTADLELHGIEVVTEFCPALPKLYIDKIQIQQVLLNLLRNSIDALTADGVTEKWIRVCVSQTHADAEVVVTDSGPGVAQVDVFKPFVTTKANGMGMGLAISRTIMEHHSGRMWLPEAPPQGGGAFAFSLPISHGQE